MRFVRHSVVACALVALAPSCDSSEPPVAVAVTPDAGHHDQPYDVVEICQRYCATQQQLAAARQEKERLEAKADQLQLEVAFLKSLQPDAGAP